MGELVGKVLEDPPRQGVLETHLPQVDVSRNGTCRG